MSSSASQHMSGFSDLPLEVLAEILKHVHDWRDLLIMRQVCKQLNDVSRTREVWTGQYQSYLAENKFSLAAEARLDKYSAPELESWVLQRRGVDWECDSCPVYERELSFDVIVSLTLVPGGRWLLVTNNHSGKVSYHDLEEDTMRGEPLTPSRGYAGEFFTYGTAIDIDPASPTLKFCMVTYPEHYIVISDPSGADSLDLFRSVNLDLMFWSVKLRGHGSSAWLEERLLHSFPATEPNTHVISVSLSGHLFARLMCKSVSRTYIEIFDWKSSTASVHRRTVIFPDVRNCVDSDLLLLPGRQLVFLTSDVFLYDIGRMTDDQPITPVIPQVLSEARWSETTSDDYMDGYRLKYHQSIQHNDAVVLVMTGEQHVWHLVVPHNVEHPPRLVDYMDISHKYMPQAAVTNKVLLEKRSRGYSIRADRNYLADMTIGPAKLPCETTCLLRTRSGFGFFDTHLLVEDIGRIIIGAGDNHYYILDTSRFPKFL